MKETLWKLFAWFVSRRLIADLIIGHATRTPYFHLDGYMLRWWAANRHDDGTRGQAEQAHKSGRDRDPRSKLMRRFPSVRVHCILRPDTARHKHDHPFDFRTIILRNWYVEQRGELGDPASSGERHFRNRGDTGTMKFGSFHNIVETHSEGVWTLVFCYDYRGIWGFDKDGVKVPWREYLGYE